MVAALLVFTAGALSPPTTRTSSRTSSSAPCDDSDDCFGRSSARANVFASTVVLKPVPATPVVLVRRPDHFPLAFIIIIITRELTSHTTTALLSFPCLHRLLRQSQSQAQRRKAKHSTARLCTTRGRENDSASAVT